MLQVMALAPLARAQAAVAVGLVVECASGWRARLRGVNHKRTVGNVLVAELLDNRGLARIVETQE